MKNQESKSSLRRILLAPDSFKESLPAARVAEAMALGLQSRLPEVECVLCPVADGGEGTLEALVAALALSVAETIVQGPYPSMPQLVAKWGDGPSGPGWRVLEAAQVIGLEPVPIADRAPEAASSHGLGELMLRASSDGVEELIIALGGTATVDGGIGALGAFGVVFLDHAGARLPCPLVGSDLSRIASCEVPDEVRRRLNAMKIRLAVDVPDSPLLGSAGAARTFGPQKGADPEMVERLEAGMRNWAGVCSGDVEMKGAGSAGGIAFGLATVLEASIESGVELVLEAVDFAERCREVDLVLTGEGCLDDQSRMGKAAVRVANIAMEHGVSTRAIVGRRAADFGVNEPFESVVSLVEHCGSDHAMNEPFDAIRSASASIIQPDI